MRLLKANFFFAFMLAFSYAAHTQTWVSYQSQQQINDLVDTGTELWLATDAGLVVVNKTTLETTVFNTNNSPLSNNHIQTITLAPDGAAAWIGTYDVVMGLFDGSGIQDVTTPQHPAYNPQRTMLYDLEIAPNGDFWLGTSDGVFHRQGQTWRHYDEDEFWPSFFEAWDIAINAAGDVFVASVDIYQLSNGTWINLTENTDIHPYLHAECFFSHSGDLYVAGDLDEIARFDGTNWQTYPHGLNGSQIKGFTEDANGDLYFYAQGNGIYKRINDVWTAEEDAQTSAFGNHAAYFYIDEDNRRWLNDNIHLSVNNNGDIQAVLISQHTLPSNSTYNVSKGADGTMYFITASDQISSVAADGTWSLLPLPADAPPFTSYADILALANDDIWLASSAGLHHYNGTDWTLTSLDACKSLAADSQGKIYARASASIYAIDNGTVSEYNASNSPLSTSIMTGIGVDPADHLWIAESDLWAPNSPSFIHKVSSAGAWTTYSDVDYPLIDRVIGAFHFDVNGNVWIPAYGTGAVKFDGTTFSNPFIGNLDLFDNYNAFSIQSDANGKLYFSHQYGVTTLFNGEWEDVLIDEVPNENSSSQALIQFDDAGNLWWASNRHGVFAYPTGITSTTLTDTPPNHHFSCYPNPARHQAKLDFTLPAAAHVKASLYNSWGQLMTQWEIGQLPAGRFQENIPVAEWPKGLYFVQLHAGDRVATQLLVIQ